jgi:hypothetical protein
VVKELQASKRPVELDVLMRRKPTPPSPVQITPAQYLGSFNENRANMFKELNAMKALDGRSRIANNLPDALMYDKAATKAAKYFIRQLDAAHHAGIDLTKALPQELEAVISQTLKLDKARSTPAEFAKALQELNISPQKYVDSVMEASERLSSRAIALSPMRKHARVIGEYYDEVNRLRDSIPGVADPFPLNPVPKPEAPRIEVAKAGSPHALPPLPPDSPPAPPLPPASVANAADPEGVTAAGPALGFPAPPGGRREIPLPDPPAIEGVPATQYREGASFVDPDGRKIDLGTKIGSGGYADVYQSANSQEVVKILRNGDEARSAPEVAQMIHDNSKMLADAGIPQLQISHAQVKGDAPYLVQAKAPEGSQFFKWETYEQGGRKALEAAGWTADHDEAVAELMYAMAKKDIFWEDAGLENVFFHRGPDNKLRAIVLDQDRMGRWDALNPYMQKWRDDLQMTGKFEGIRSLHNASPATYQFSGPMEAMAKNLERKGWIRFDPESGAFMPGMIDAEVVNKRFQLGEYLIKPKPTSMTPLLIPRHVLATAPAFRRAA